jgi:hypothetical protein
MEVSKTEFRVAYEKAHDLLVDGLEIVDTIYTETSYEGRRDLVARLREATDEVKNLSNSLCAGEDDGSGY